MTNAAAAAPPVTGDLLIAGAVRTGTGDPFQGIDPTTGDALPPVVRAATDVDVRAAAAAAADAFTELRRWSGAQRGALLRGIAGRLEAFVDVLIETADRETGLGIARLTGELGRTCGQLRAFADLVEAGDYVDAIIDRADPTATPARPDVRRMLMPLGPVAVFGASNFPLAFGVPGGDTASALAAGCPVIAKGHPSHPATSELCGRAIAAAVAETGAPGGTFSLLQGPSPGLGAAMVTAPEVRAVGFTGSLRGGRALFDLAAARPVPIPVYAEMGSVNPVFVTAAAQAARGDAIAAGLATSFTMGTGQFCTKPGLVLVAGDARLLAASVARALGDAAPGVMLNEGLAGAFRSAAAGTSSRPGVTVSVGSDGPDRGAAPASPGGRCLVAPAVLLCDLDTFRATPELSEEHFGPLTVLVDCGSDAALVEAADGLGGNLTATIHAEDVDGPLTGELAELLTDRVGRIVWNGYPTGVAVVHAMQHGGPYPATTAPGTTSVGTTAIRRFLRPVAHQDAPDDLLPPALQRANPLGLLRTLDGAVTRDAG